MRSEKKKSSALTLQEAAHRIQTGDLKNLPAALSLLAINIKDASASDLEALVEWISYKAYGHKILKAHEFSGVQRIRVLLNEGKFDEVYKETREIITDDPELMLERARNATFMGHFAEVLAPMRQLLQDPSVPLNTRGVACQISGHALLELGDTYQARILLLRAIDFATQAGNTLGLISARLFLSRLNAFERNFEGAQAELQKTCTALVSHMGSFRWFLGYYRALSQANFLAGNSRCIQEASVGIHLARALGDELFEYRGVLELMLMESKFGVTVIRDRGRWLSKMTDFAGQSQSDLAQWIDAVTLPNQTIPHTHTAAVFMAETLNLTASSPVMQDLDQSGAQRWIFDSLRGLLIDTKFAEFVSIVPESPMSKLISLLAQHPEGLSVPEIFERVWDLPWKPERHKNLVKVSLFRLTKLIKSLSLSRKDGLVHIEQPGFIF